jgi:hypothetical protein
MNINDNVKFKGYFSIEQIDKDGKVLDKYEDKNMIMEFARESMAELFSMFNTNTGINKIVFGTRGHLESDIITPKTASEGFVKDRDRLFSEYIEFGDLDTIKVIKGDVIKYTGNNATNGVTNNYYEYTQENPLSDIQTVDVDFSDGSWVDLGVTEPYTYPIEFTLPYTNDSYAIVNNEPDSGSEVYMSQEGSEVTFVFNMSPTAGNSQDNGTSIFTEAAMYANGRIFSMKTFRAKVKNETVVLRIIWKIIF